MSDGYFLSADNPVANVDQRDLEDLALRLLDRPEVQRGRAMATGMWRSVMAWPAAEQMSRFDHMIDEWVFQFALRAANSDANRPGVLWTVTPPGRWFGHDIPGSRWGGDSPDFIYRTIPIAHGGRYELRGRPSGEHPPGATYSLIGHGGAVPPTLDFLDSKDVACGEDGAFVITLDSEPAGGRINHLQTKPGADHLLVRDVIGDWLTQTPNALRIVRLNDPDGPPPNLEELGRRAAQGMVEHFYFAFFVSQSGNGQPPNVMRPPQSSGASGGMASQWGSKINLCLEEDEALVITTNGAGANFRNAVLCDLFFLSIEYWKRTSSLNSSQMAPDEDGRFTFVVAHQDPGVHNWLDTGGLRRTIFGHRWQAFANDAPTETPTITSQVVKLADLAGALPAGVKTIDAAGRREQLARRRAGYDRRFIGT